MQLHRFLLATKMRILSNIDGKDLSAVLTSEKLEPMIQKVPLRSAQEFVKQARDQIDVLITNAEKHAEAKIPKIIEQAKTMMLEKQSEEIQRLEALAAVNPNIKEEEIEYLKEQTEYLLQCIMNASLKLDAVRLVIAI